MALLAGGSAAAGGPARQPPVRVIGQTIVVGETDPAVWTYVLDVLPARPRRIEILDVESLSIAARRKVEGRDAFVLTGQTALGPILSIATGDSRRFVHGGAAMKPCPSVKDRYRLGGRSRSLDCWRWEALALPVRVHENRRFRRKSSGLRIRLR